MAKLTHTYPRYSQGDLLSKKVKNTFHAEGYQRREGYNGHRSFFSGKQSSVNLGMC